MFVEEVFLEEFKIDYNDENLFDLITEFYELYSARPVKDNHGGMKSPHLFNTWYIIKQKQPKMVIESGVWKGLGTWLIEKAAPDCKIISIDLDFSNLVYKSDKVTYLNRDIRSYDWPKIFKELNVNPSEALVFLDDHQNFLDRLEFLYNLGIGDVMYEDNYPPSQGNCLSPKKIIACQDYIIDEHGVRTLNKFSYNYLDKFYTYVNHYQELPPLFKVDTTRWGDKWAEPAYLTPPALLNNKDRSKYPIFFEEADSYTWICYMRLGV